MKQCPLHAELNRLKQLDPKLQLQSNFYSQLVMNSMQYMRDLQRENTIKQSIFQSELINTYGPQTPSQDCQILSHKLSRTLQKALKDMDLILKEFAQSSGGSGGKVYLYGNGEKM